MSVYFIRAGLTDAIKIGWAANPERRLSMLQVGHHEFLSLIRTIDGPRYIEPWLQNKFRKGHIRGEWYKFTQEMLTITPDDVPPGMPAWLETNKTRGGVASRPIQGMDLREIIHEKGLRQNWVAREIGFTESGLSELLRGTRKLRLEKVELLASILQISVEEVVRAAMVEEP